MHDLVVRDLGRARDRTLGLTDVDEPRLVAQHDPLMSPLVWDLAHVGQQEELWLLRGGDQARPGMLPPDVDALYDAFKHPPRRAPVAAARGPWIPRPPGPPAGPPSYPNSKIKIHYAEPRPPRPATGQRERSGLGGQVVLIPHSSLTSGSIGEPSHSQPNPWKELSQLAPAGEQIAQFGSKKAVQIQQPIADQNGGSGREIGNSPNARSFLFLDPQFARRRTLSLSRRSCDDGPPGRI
jgi:DinB superfamily